MVVERIHREFQVFLSILPDSLNFFWIASEEWEWDPIEADSTLLLWSVFSRGVLENAQGADGLRSDYEDHSTNPDWFVSPNV